MLAHNKESDARTAELGNAPYPATAACAPRRVAFLVNAFPVISETFVVNQAAELVKRGIDLRIFALNPPSDGSPVSNSLVSRWRLLERTSTTITPDELGTEIQPMTAMHRYPLLSAHVFLARLGLGPEHVRKTLAQAATLTAHEPFDIVHCQFATLGLTALRHIRFRTLQTRKLVIHVRGYDVSRFVLNRGNKIYTDLFRKADLLIANCDHFRRRLVDLGCPPEKTIVIGSPVDCARFAPPPERKSEPHSVRLLAVGRLVAKKGFDDAIRAVAELVRTGMNVNFCIIGEGPMREELERLIKTFDVGGSVQLLGGQSSETVINYLHTTDILLAPSVRTEDGDEDAPVNSLKEAMATGLPVIATRHGGIPELVDDGVNGYLTPERDPMALAEAVRRLSGERHHWPEMGRAGRAKVLAEYDQQVVMERTLAAYESLLEGEERRDG